MNILTDILSLFKRNKFVKEALPNDVLVLGLNQEPDMTGIASPIPYKSVRLIKVKDLNIAAEHCDHTNTPMVPASNSGTVYQKTYVDPETQKCTVYYKTSNYRVARAERTLAWNDKSINIKWPIKKPILSDKDKNGIDFISLKKELEK